jgi:hypothetical protein
MVRARTNLRPVATLDALDPYSCFRLTRAVVLTVDISGERFSGDFWSAGRAVRDGAQLCRSIQRGGADFPTWDEK